MVLRLDHAVPMTAFFVKFGELSIDSAVVIGRRVGTLNVARSSHNFLLKENKETKGVGKELRASNE
jgi:hypothetical protein